MGRKGQGHKPKHTVKTKNQRNISNEEKEIIESVDKLLRICTLPQQQNVSKALDQQDEIYLITEKIKNLQINKSSANSVDNRATTATIESFTKWVNENGGQLKGCTISEFKGFELGLMANTEIPQSSLVITVPRKIMMSIETTMKSDLKELIDKDQILKNMPNVTLAIFLLNEKFKKNSFWKPYIDILPKQYSTVMYFTLEDLGELRGSPTLEIALRQIKSIARQYAYFHKLFNTSEDAVSKSMRGRFTFNEYCWAVSTVMTRQNTIPSEGGEHMINALIPLWDMCNHTNGKISTDFNPELDRCECLALKDFKPGEQFFIFYGARTNADLFIHNGFVYEDNVHDGYSVRLGISKSDPLHEKRNELLKKLSIPSTCDFFIKRGTSPVEGRLLAFLRIFNMNEGKTSIIGRYTEGEFSSTYKITIGADFALKTIEWDEDTRVHLHLWDIAGHERFGSLTGVFYRHAVAAAIVFDLTRPETFTSVEKWLGDIRRKVHLPGGQQIPIVILANKGDITVQTLPSQIEDYCKANNILAWFITSAKNNLHIDEAMIRLTNAAIQNHHNLQFPLITDDIVSLSESSENNTKHTKCC